MPELPEVSALAGFVADHAGGQHIVAVSIASLNVLTTYDPPASALVGRVLTGATRHGKFLDLITVPDGEPDGAQLHLVIHLARAGWLRWSDKISAVPPKMGGPIALRVRFESGGFDITEAGTKKSVAAAVVTDPMQVPGVARLGPDAMGQDGNGDRPRRTGGPALRPQRAHQERADRPDRAGRNRQRLLGRDPAHGKAFAVRDGRKAERRGHRFAALPRSVSVLTGAIAQNGRGARPPG